MIYLLVLADDRKKELRRLHLHCSLRPLRHQPGPQQCSCMHRIVTIIISQPRTPPAQRVYCVIKLQLVLNPGAIPQTLLNSLLPSFFVPAHAAIRPSQAWAQCRLAALKPSTRREQVLRHFRKTVAPRWTTADRSLDKPTPLVCQPARLCPRNIDRSATVTAKQPVSAPPTARKCSTPCKLAASASCTSPLSLPRGPDCCSATHKVCWGRAAFTVAALEPLNTVAAASSCFVEYPIRLAPFSLTPTTLPSVVHPDRRPVSSPAHRGPAKSLLHYRPDVLHPAICRPSPPPS
ncbi:hypothetical protein M011DRAFT_133829 [Sporormia fimetaria CBS 119925]|uniref:Uncharacterized protein n=1 Tax=Sporormia fimetaria CBS 119925 TaxID=1340428 RepID=A0A6A6V9A3_9PLEO|nr:hypothetical protein M011DRAFT_133829 [Sporormia fimetaria CBS 119925]